MKILTRYCFCFLLGSIFPSSAQPALHYLERLTSVDGLSSNAITDIVQDRNGFLWIGTDHGLNRYDGDEITSYFAGLDSLSLADNGIHRLISLDDFHIAIATDHGLNILDIRDYSFRTILFPSDPNWKSYDNQLLFMEKDYQGNLWIGTPVSIYRLNKNLKLQNVFRSHYILNDIGKARIHYVYRIIPLSTGEVLFWLKSGLHIWKPKTDSLIKVREQSREKWSFLENSSYQQCTHVYGHYLIYLNLATQKLVVYDEQTQRKVSCHLPLYDWKEKPDIDYISQLNNGWISISFVSKGMSLIKLQDLNGKLRVYNDGKVYFPNNAFEKVVQDNEGNLWSTTYGHGVLKIAPYKQMFSKVDLLDEKTQRPSPFEITSFYRLHDKLFVGSYGGGFYEWNRILDQLEQHSAKYGPYSENMVWNFSLHHRDTLWLGTQQGLLWYHLKNKNMGRVAQDHPAVLDSVAITTQFTDSENLVWMGLGHGKGVCVYDKIKKSFCVFHNTNLGFPFRYPVSIAEDKNTNLWFVSDATANLATWNRKEKCFKKVIIPQFKGKTYLHTGKLYLDKKNNTIWYGVQNMGLVRYNIGTGQVKTYGQENGLGTDMIFSIAKDKNGVFWMTTAQGISSFDPIKENFVNYGPKEGLTDTYFSEGLLYDTLANRMYAGARGKVISFLPENLTTEKPPLRAKITGLKIDNEKFPVVHDGPMALPWKSNDITLFFTAVNLTSGKENKYAYKLGGKKARWTTLGRQHQIRLASLAPGDYTFTLKAARKDGLWSPFIDQLRFRIRPPFVKTIWFYILVLLALCGLIYGRYRYRLATVLRLEKLRAHISQDLHDDIGSRLTNISLMSRMAGQEESKDLQKGNLFDKIQEESRAISESMREIVWSINPQNDTLGEAMPRLLRYASGLLENKEIEVRASIADLTGIKMDMDKRRDLFLIFKEAVHNIVQHAEARKVLITVQKMNKTLRFQILDDGKGFEMNRLDYKNGLDHMKQRIQKHQWQIHIDSRSGNGTQITLEIKTT